MNRVVKQQGFTLIELMLAMAFISVLLLAIATTVIQVGTIYNHGMTLKEVNQTSREIASDVRRSVASSTQIVLADDYIETSAGGRVCLGSVTYIWNYAKTSPTDWNIVNYKGKPARLLKVEDSTRFYCIKNGLGMILNKNIVAADESKTLELLQSGDKNLGVHNFRFTSQPTSVDNITGQQLYVLNYTIGTTNIPALNFIGTKTDCKAPGEPGADPVYCNVQQFSLVLRAGSKY